VKIFFLVFKSDKLILWQNGRKSKSHWPIKFRIGADSASLCCVVVDDDDNGDKSALWRSKPSGE